MLTLDQAFENLCKTSQQIQLNWESHVALEQSRQIIKAALDELKALKADNQPKLEAVS